jgi:hypothetical protein
VVESIRKLARQIAGEKDKKEEKAPDKKHPKRGNYKQKECPYCHAMVGNLGNHVRLKHPTEAPPREITKETLVEGKLPKAEDAPTYYCTTCHAELRKGENPCWNCGATLVWEGIE